MTPIRAFAAPYNVMNSHHEILEPRAFRGLLRSCEMLFMHKLPIGWWHHVWEDERGVWAEGEYDEEALARLERKLGQPVPEISITFNYDVSGPAGRAELKRLGLKWDKLRNLDYTKRHAILLDVRQERTTPIRLGPDDVINIDEISLVTRGSFPGTTWEIDTDGL